MPCNTVYCTLSVPKVNRNQYVSFSPCILTLTSDLAICLHYNPLHCYCHPSQCCARASQHEDWWSLCILICDKSRVLERHCYHSDSTERAKNQLHYANTLLPLLLLFNQGTWLGPQKAKAAVTLFLNLLPSVALSLLKRFKVLTMLIKSYFYSLETLWIDRFFTVTNAERYFLNVSTVVNLNSYFSVLDERYYGYNFQNWLNVWRAHTACAHQGETKQLQHFKSTNLTIYHYQEDGEVISRCRQFILSIIVSQRLARIAHWSLKTRLARFFC